MTRKRLERFDDVGIVDETNGFGLDFAEKAEGGLRSAIPRRGSSTVALLIFKDSVVTMRNGTVKK